MITLDARHPQVLDFINVKNDDKKVTGANISLRLSDEFLNAVQEDKPITLRFPIDVADPKIKKDVSAKEIWKAIIHSAWLRAEPGLLFWDNILKNSPADCYADSGFATTSTNPCSELPLSNYDSCRLLTLNWFSYVENPFTDKARFNFKLFSEHCEVAQRLMDDMIDLEIENISKIIKKVEGDPEDSELKRQELILWKNIRHFCEKGRSTRTGETAVGDTLAALGLKYGEDDAIKTVDKIQKTQKLSCYRSSVEMAKEIGAFEVYDAKKEKDCQFIQRIQQEDPDLYRDMVKHGRRNISLLTIAPTGSVSILTQTTSGIEPLFKLDPYIRRKKINHNDTSAKVDFTDDLGDKWQEFRIYHPKVKMWMDITGETSLKKSPWYGSCAEDLDWKKRVLLQSRLQSHIDHAISSTINLPEDVSEEKVAEIYETAWKSGCKGITVYRDNCRTGVLVEDKPAKEEVVASILKSSAPKRPDVLEASVHHFVIKSHVYYVVVGPLNGEPYEVFTGNNHDKEGEIYIPKTVKHGQIQKLGSKGKYCLVTEDSREYSLNNGHNDSSADALTRLISTSLRHGADIIFIVQQLEKTTGDMNSFAKALARALKKYVKDGESRGDKCKSCGSKSVTRQEGCVVCRECGWSGCS